MPLLNPGAMQEGRPLQGWVGRGFHSESMTFMTWEIAADAAPLHEHHHPNEEVWNILEGELVLVVDGEQWVLGPGSAAIIPPDVPHSALPRSRCRALVVDWPIRGGLPGVKTAEPNDAG